MRRLAIFSAAFTLAAGLYVYLPRGSWLLWLALGCLLLSLLGFHFGGKWEKRVCAAALGLCVGVAWCFGFWYLTLRPLEQLAGQERTVLVQLREQPWETRYGAAAEVTAELEGRTCRAILYADAALLELNTGDRAVCTAKPRMASSSSEMGRYSLSQGVQMYLYAASELETLPGRVPWNTRICQWLQGRISALYDGETAGLVRALLTGDRSGLSYAVRNDLAVAGVSHAIAVSGMHVSMLLAMVAFLCGGMPRPTAAIGVPVILCFAVVTGASPSVCRAAVMQSLLLLAPLLRRESDMPTSIGAAALVLLLQNPWAIASVSFQLSFASVLGLCLFFRRLYRTFLPEKPGGKPKAGRIARFLAAGVSATLSATALTLPLTVFYFRMVSLAAPLTNLLVLWAITGIFALGLISCLLGPLGFLPAWAAAVLGRYVLTACRWIAAFPCAAAYPCGMPLLVWGICAYGAALLLLLWKRCTWRIWGAGLLAVTLLLCIGWNRWQFIRGEMRFSALDVGQGQCLLLESQGFTAVVDCGGSSPESAGELAARTLHTGGETTLDALVLTHYDVDHAGGVCQLLYRVAVKRLYLPDVEDETGLRGAIEAAAEARGSEVIYVTELTDVPFSTGKLRLFPPVSPGNGNDGGVCVLATAAEYDILVTGDMSIDAEMRLLSAYGLPEVDLLVAGHHGAKTSTSQLLLDTVKPGTVVISVGDNSYGHPAEETLARIKAAGAEVHRTDREGTVVIRR